jgi:hypothetical protein
MIEQEPQQGSDKCFSHQSIEAGKNVLLLIASGQGNIIDKIFPFVHEILKRVRLPNVLYLLLLIWIFLQQLLLSVWNDVIGAFNSNSLISSTSYTITEIFHFISPKFQANNSLKPLIICSTITTLEIMIVIFQTIYYHFKRQFVFWVLYVTRFILETFSIIMIAPLSANIGQMSSSILKDGIQVKSILTLCAFIFFFFVNIVFLYFIRIGANTSPYLSQSYFANWQGVIPFQSLLIPSLFSIFIYIASFFREWIMITLLFGKIIFNIYQEYICFQFTYIDFRINVLYLTLYLTIILLDVYSIIVWFTSSVNVIIYFLILFCFPFIAYFPFNLCLKHYYKILREELSSESYEQFEFCEVSQNSTPNDQLLLQDNRKCAYFYKLGIDKSFRCALKYLAVGVAEHCDLFLDMSLIRFIADHHHTADCFSLITQLLSYFPHESRLLNYFFYEFLLFPHLNIGQRFLIFQVHQVKNLRESASSSELSLRLCEMRNQVKRGISLSRIFFNNPNVQLVFLFQIKVFTDKIKSFYDELLNKFQNNIRLHEDYSYFLIECATDYSNALKIKHKCNLLEKGRNFAVDDSFSLFVQRFPSYLKKNILDVKGNFIEVERNSAKNHNSSSLSQNVEFNNSYEKNEEYTVEIEDYLGKMSFPQHRLRLACQKAFEGKRATKSVYLKYSLISTFIIGLSILLFIGFYFYFYFDSRLNEISKFDSLEKMSVNFFTCIDMILIQICNQTNSYFKESIFPQIVKDDGHTSEDEMSVFKFSGDFIDNQNDLIEEAFLSINHFYDIIIVQLLSGVNADKKYDNFTQSVVPLSFCSKNAINVYYNDLIDNYTFYPLFIYIFSQMKFLINDCPFNVWNETSELCEIMHSYQPIADTLNDIFIELLNMGDEQFNLSNRSLLFISIFCSVPFLIIVLPGLIYFSISSTNEFLYILSLMQNIDSKSKSDAASCISLQKTQSISDESNNSFANSGTLNFFLLIFFMCFFV